MVAGVVVVVVVVRVWIERVLLASVFFCAVEVFCFVAGGSLPAQPTGAIGAARARVAGYVCHVQWTVCRGYP